MDQIIEAVVDQTGNIQIPEPFHEALGLVPGKKWVVQQHSDGELSLRPVLSAESPLEYENGVLVFNGKVDDEVAKNWLAIINNHRERPLFRNENDDV